MDQYEDFIIDQLQQLVDSNKICPCCKDIDLSILNSLFNLYYYTITMMCDCTMSMEVRIFHSINCTQSTMLKHHRGEMDIYHYVPKK
jgi:hypothetical protein